MGKSSAPAPDPRIGEAAVKSAELGDRYLTWMQGQSDKANSWADQDRARYKDVFEPLEDRMIADATSYTSPERKAMAASEAIADVRQQGALGRQQQTRQMAAVGVNPASGRFASETRRGATGEALAAAGAGNLARRKVEAVGDAKMADVVNMGRGLAVNPGQSLGMAGNMAGAGFQGAMGGQQQMGSMLTQQHQMQMQGWQANNSNMAGIGQGVGMIAGAFMSSKDVKTNKREAMSVLDAVKDMPVEQWDYKPGKGDGGSHIGPYAEDFKAKTGLGDGKTINAIDLHGVTMKAVQELASVVDIMSGKLDKMKTRAA